MAKYTIIATIAKIEKNEIFIKGCGKYFFVGSNEKQWNILEKNQNVDAGPELICVTEPISYSSIGYIGKNILANAMLQRKALKITLDDSRKNIIAVENPDA